MAAILNWRQIWNVPIAKNFANFPPHVCTKSHISIIKRTIRSKLFTYLLHYYRSCNKMAPRQNLQTPIGIHWHLDRIELCRHNWILSTEMNSVEQNAILLWQNAVLLRKYEFCWTEYISVWHLKIVSYRMCFCSTKCNFVWQNVILLDRSDLCWQNWGCPKRRPVYKPYSAFLFHEGRAGCRCKSYTGAHTRRTDDADGGVGAGIYELNTKTLNYIHARMYVCMCVCMYACMYVCMYVCMYACMYVCMYVHVCMYVCMCVCMYACMYVCMYACMHVCMFVCMYTYVCMYACVYVCRYTCMYACEYVWMYACMYVIMYVCMYLFMYASVYVCMHTCMYTCMYVHVYKYMCMHACMRKKFAV